MKLLESLCLEHLEELSVLYEQRLWLINNQSRWRDVENIEKRMEAHVYALTIEGESGIDICKRQAIEGDYGELFGAVSVFCLQNLQDVVESVLSELDYNDEKKVKAVTDAICYEWPKEWEKTFLPWLFDQFEKVPGIISLTTEIIGYARLSVEEKLLSFINNNDLEKKEILSIIHAFGRLQSFHGPESIINNTEKYDSDCVDAAFCALIRSGNSNLFNRISATISSKELPGFSAGLYGNHETLAQIADSKDKNHILSASLLGLTAIIPKLIEDLTDNDIAETASVALDLITGAGLQENVFIPDEIDEDMLFDDELEKHKKGELYPTGKEPGLTITRISQDFETWKNWWNENQGQFNPDLRYRFGKLYCPKVLVEIIDSNNQPNYIRQLAVDELLIRYGLNVHFETFMPVLVQQKAINKFKKHLNHSANLFEPGKWYLNGKEIDNRQSGIKENVSSLEIM